MVQRYNNIILNYIFGSALDSSSQLLKWNNAGIFKSRLAKLQTGGGTRTFLLWVYSTHQWTTIPLAPLPQMVTVTHQNQSSTSSLNLMMSDLALAQMFKSATGQKKKKKSRKLLLSKLFVWLSHLVFTINQQSRERGKRDGGMQPEEKNCTLISSENISHFKEFRASENIFCQR